MHFSANLLPSIEGSLAVDNAAASLSNIESNLSELEKCLSDSSPVHRSSLARFLNSLTVHLRSLKYEVTKSLRVRAISTLLEVYKVPSIAHDQKVKVLESARALIRKKHTPLDFKLTQWRSLWDEALSHVLRDDFGGSTCNHNMLAKLVSSIVAFVHDARMYIPREDVAELVKEAHQKLENTVHVQSVEGLLLLLNCLPTDFDGYDEAVPQWIDIWKRISFNPAWDSCWLTLLCRARKFTQSYDWTELAPTLQTKARELMSLPALRGKIPAGSSYPLVMPAFYLKLIPTQIDAKKMGLNKLAKIMYSLTFRPAEAIAVDPSVLTPPRIYLLDADEVPKVPGFNVSANIHPQALELVNFIQTMRPFLYPSNGGSWTPMLAYFMATLVSEIGRHLGRNVAHTLFDENSESVVAYRVFEAPVHLETVQYLTGLLTSVMMESLYGKNQMMSQIAAGCLKNICSIDPTLGRLIIPFLLGALDPQAVNQSHQAPLAMSTLNVCLQPLLYPCPVVMSFLPKLLELSLPGVDPNDGVKTYTTLSMYVTILGRLPIKKSYEAPNQDSWPPSMLSMTSSQDGLNAEHSALYAKYLDKATLQSNLDSLAIAFEDWAPALLDKIFDIVEAQEAPKLGKKSPDVITGYVDECTSLLFRACSQDHHGGYALRTILEQKVIDFYRTHLPMNAVKLSGKIIACISEVNPKCIPRFISALLESDVLDGTCSTEKLSFRLRLLAGAVRYGREETMANIETLRPMMGPKFLFHTDKFVRKGALKLLKDILRGATSVYPVYNTAAIDIADGEWSNFTEKKLLVGSPSRITTGSEYHVPSSAALATMASLVRDTAVLALKDINATVEYLRNEESKGSSAEDLDGTAMKKLEDRMQQLLKVVTKVLRGTAEVLGDEFDKDKMSSVFKFADGIGRDRANTEDRLDATRPFIPMQFGRAHLLHELVEADRQLFAGLRADVLGSLTSLGELLIHKQDKSSDDGQLLQLQNRAGVVNSWLKLLSVTVKQRMSNLKDTNNTKEWLSTSVRSSRTMIARTMRKAVKLRTQNCTINLRVNKSNSLQSKWRVILSTSSYWLGNEYTPVALSNRGWIQYAIILQQFSFLSMKMLRSDDNIFGEQFNQALYQLTQVCQHEYDAIRQKALHAFSSVHTRFGHKAIDSIQRVFEYVQDGAAGRIVNPDELFARTSGIFNLFRQSIVMRKLSRQWDLTESFLNAVAACPRLIASVEEQDKRERLSALVADAFAGYAQQWGNVPFIPGKDSAIELLQSSLTSMGFNTDGSLITSDSYSERDSGLRAQTFTGFTIVHLIGHNDINITPGMWAWAISTTATAHGQPVQFVALTALTRLCAITLGPRAKTHKMLDDSRHCILSFLSPDKNDIWNSLLTGLSHARSKSVSDNAQWSNGINAVLHACTTLRSTLPRKSFCVMYDRNVFSTFFLKENAFMIFTLFHSELVPLTSTNVKSVMEATNDLPKESEDEDRASNATRAEVFAGLLRAALSNSNSTKLEDMTTTVAYLSKILFDTVEKVSLEYSKDWAEALHLAVPNPSHPLAKSIVNKVMSDLSSLLDSGRSIKEGEDGFTYEGKKMQLAQSILVADVTVSTSERRQSKLALQLVDILAAAGPSVVSCYRTSRVSMARIVALLTDSAPPTSFVSIIQILMSVCDEDNQMKTESVEEVQNDNINKDALDMLCNLMELLMSSCRKLDHLDVVLPNVLSVLLRGSGNANIETAKHCHTTCLLLAQSIKLTRSSTLRGQHIVCTLQKESNDSSWHVRETVMLCLAAFMMDNWVSLSTDDKKLCKDVFTEGFVDPKPEIQQFARAGMVGYLSFKTPSEMKTIAEAYCRNSDKYIMLEKRRKKEAVAAGSDGLADKVDPKFANTVMMMSCVVLCSPYDMPVYMPQLVSSLVRHKLSTALKDAVSRTVLEFKRTHQDRWEEYKNAFSYEQLDSLVNASHVSYCS